MRPLSPASSAAEVTAHLRSLASQANRAGMQRYRIKVERALGVPHGVQRDIARTIGRNHERAFALWATGIAEARFIAALTVDPRRFMPEDARSWAADFDSWDVVDGVSSLFAATEGWRGLIDSLAADEREFVRRSAFATLAWAAVHRKKEPDQSFAALLPLVEQHATDGRNFVRKAVSWALRSIGKRSETLHGAALATAERLAASSDGTARWIGRNAVRELTDAGTLARLSRKRPTGSQMPAPAA